MTERDDNVSWGVFDAAVENKELRGKTETLDARVDITNKRISELKTDLKEDISVLKTDISDLRKDNRMLLGVMIGSWATLMGAIITAAAVILAN